VEPAAETPPEEPQAETPAEADAPAEEPVAEQPQADAPAEEPAAEAPAAQPEAGGDDAPAAPRAKPAIPGADLEVDIVGEGEDPFGAGEQDVYGHEEEEDEPAAESEEDDGGVVEEQPIAAMIELAADARYRATGKRKTAVARVILKPGNGEYLINGKTLNDFFPRATLQRTIRQPLETVGYSERRDVVARMHGGGVSAQADALRHGISKALLDADPNLRGELKRRGFLTRDARAKERKKAGLKKARKRPQFSKR
jgi:small subunit ribosomal protein S9